MAAVRQSPASMRIVERRLVAERRKDAPLAQLIQGQVSEQEPVGLHMLVGEAAVSEARQSPFHADERVSQFGLAQFAVASRGELHLQPKEARRPAPV
jgi:hypothetical protein